MPVRNIIVIGTSAGGVKTLAEVVRGLPAGFAASLFVVCHVPPGTRSLLPEILSRAGPLLASHARDGEPFHPGHIYLAPPDRHLLLGPDEHLRVVGGPRENYHRPAIDPLFRSAARYYGARVVGVILTGGLSDGAAGLLAVRAAGGVAVVQDPHDAVIAAMPQNASDIAGADYIVPSAELAAVLTDLVGRSPEPGERQQMDPIERMPEVVAQDLDSQQRNERQGQLATYSCPECGGTLWQVDDVGQIRFRCHVGHAYNGETLLAEQSETLEAALWTAVRVFREKSVLGRQLAAAEQAKGNAASADRFKEQATQAAEYADLIIKHILGGNNNGPEGFPDNGNRTP